MASKLTTTASKTTASKTTASKTGEPNENASKSEGTLLPRQIEHAHQLISALKNYGSALDGSDTGAGKTYVAASICAQLGLRPAVIAPKSALSNWYEVLALFGVAPLFVVNYETIKNNKYYANRESFLNDARTACPYILVQKVEVAENGRLVIKTEATWKLPPRTLLIFDEAHRANNGVARGTTINSVMLAAARDCIDMQSRIWVMMLSATSSEVLIKTAVILYVLGFYEPYSQRFFNLFIATLPPGNPMKAVHDLIFPKHGSRLKISEVMESVDVRAPDGATEELIVEGGVTIPVTAESAPSKSGLPIDDVQAYAYLIDKERARCIEEEHIKIKEALMDLRRKGTPGPGFGVIMKHWQNIEILKIGVVKILARYYLQHDHSVVIFVNFDRTRLMMIEELNALTHPGQIGTIHGSQSAAERGAMIAGFMADELRVLVCNIKAGGSSISLHDTHGRYKRVSLIFPTWTAVDLKQALGRIYRINTKSDATQRVIYCRSGDSTLKIEENICKTVNAKLKNIELLNNGDTASCYEFV